MLGVYDRMETGDGQAYRQRGGEWYIYQYNNDWVVGRTIGDSTGYMYTSDLNSNHWYFWTPFGTWKNDSRDITDPTIQFLPLTSSSCIIQPSIHLTSTGPTATNRPHYLGTFHIVQGLFSAGRPVWRNSKGKVLIIRNGWSSRYVVMNDDLTLDSDAVRSASGPTCPTDAKAASSAWFQDNWQFNDWIDSKWVEDDKIRITSVNPIQETIAGLPSII